MATILGTQNTRPKRYVEPFAGGAGVGLRLLVDEHVDEIIINDLNPGVAAFWRAVFERSDELLSKIKSCTVSVDEWRRQRETYLEGPDDDVDLGFALFFLNRTNRSGILDARPIGGYEQSGRWRIDARFDKSRLSQRIEVLSTYASRVVVREIDGIDLIGEYLDRDSFIYADPPYLGKGDHLYLDTLEWSDHVRLSALLRRAGQRGGQWLITYDADERVTSELYAGYRCAQFAMAHSAAIHHAGTEYAVFGPALSIPSLKGLGSSTAEFISASEI